MNLSIFKFIFIALFIVGCGSEPKLNVKTPDINHNIPQKKYQPVQKKNGSLYGRQGSSLFADKKDLQIGDILQVVVEEALKNDSKGTRTTTKANSTGLGGGVVAPATGVTLTNGAQDRVNTVNNNIGIGFSTTTNNSFSGAANSKADEKFTTTISVIIEQTYKNGNYFVVGSRELLLDGQKQTMVLSGIIRPYDITPENTVSSSQIANLKIKYVREGEEYENMHKPWGSKILETIWPF
jgi:flagellar L-ring protein precursor FlgH